MNSEFLVKLLVAMVFGPFALALVCLFGWSVYISVKERKWGLCLLMLYVAAVLAVLTFGLILPANEGKTLTIIEGK